MRTQSWLIGLAVFCAMLVIPATFGAPQQQKHVKSGSKADINAIGNRKVARGPNLYSLESEAALGARIAQKIDRSVKLIDDPVVNEYINRIGQNLVKDSDARVPFKIKVIDSDEVNALSLPGGFVYINAGLILLADEESELAGVMAHEIAHVCARHATRDATKNKIAQVVTTSLVLLGPGGWASYAIYGGLNFGLSITFLKFSRAAESEADYLGLQYMYKAGYDPDAVISFLEKVADDEAFHGATSGLFSKHPPTRKRIKATQDEIARVLPDRDEYIVSTSDFDTIKARLLSIQAAEARHADGDGTKPTLRNRTGE
jgi:beta-barrel assembly-enhancing protease